ncbi:MAG: LamG-like jellyroll fold domain-containing protein [Saprospiraceae bacterium]
MKNIILVRHITALLVLLGLGVGLHGQTQKQDGACFSSGTETVRPTAAFFNYGSGTKMKNLSRRTKLTIGQMVVGLAQGTDSSSYYGYWTSFLVAPLPPLVTASQGELLDRIQLTWSNNPLGPFPNQGFKIFRDGVFLAAVDSKTRNYNDFNVIAGRPYNYEVRGINIYGEGQPGKAIGFQVPNGVVTGWVQTPNGNPVPNTLIALTPLQGFSAMFGFDDGALYRDTSAAGFMPAASAPWSISFWIKTDSAGADATILQLDQPYLLNIRPLVSSSGQEGISVDRGAATLLSAAFPNATKKDWHHVVLNFNNDQLRLYVDGALAAQNASPGPDYSAKELNLGTRAGTGRWRGKLDELRIYHRSLDELDLDEVGNNTASSFTTDLELYWKIDEQLGTKSFDIMRRAVLSFCGPMFSADRPTVRTAGMTNEEGFYRIEGVSYGTGTTFLARPAKDFYLHRALKFVRTENDQATLPDFSVTPKATLELWVNSAGPNGDQCLLSKRWQGNEFRVFLRENGLSSDIMFLLNGQEHNFGTLGMGYQHLAFTIDSSGTNRTVTAYKNGVSVGSRTFTGVTGDWSNPSETWFLGSRPDNQDYFDGLIDEVAMYDSTLSQPTIQQHFLFSRDPQERGLRVYFALDEGSGNRLNNSGSLLTDSGTNNGAEWSPFAPNQMTTPHVFTPGTRQVTLNPSVTSVDQVDFTDRSFVPVSGFVRYKNTDCFAEQVEILVNGQPYSPRIFTDSTGKFTIDLEPGTTATLTPVFEEHQFIPAFWEVINLSSPIAGILFNDITTRKIKVLVAGGECKKSILTPSTVCLVKVASLDECFVRTETMPYPDGQFDFEDLPPLEQMTVSVIEHSNPDVKTFFQVQGGSTVDLTERDTAINFIYFSPLQIALNSGLDTVPSCNPGVIVLNQDDQVTLSVSIVEQYEKILDMMNNVVDDGVCPLDTGSIRFINGFADMTFDTILSGPTLQYKFKVGGPNPSPPYLKTLQILGTSMSGRTGSLVKQGIVTGIRNKENTFTTQLPEVPMLILRDPPGDGSYSFWEKNNSVCTTTKATLDFSTGGGGGVTFDNAPDVKIVAAPLGVGKIIEVDTKFGAAISGTVSYQKVTDNSFETCLSVTERIATSEDDLIVGQDADVFVGLGTNIAVGFADEVTFDPMTCSPAVKQLITVEPLTPTTFLYSQFHIKNNVVRYLNSILTNPDIQLDSATRADYTRSKDLWNSFLNDNAALKNKAQFIKNLSFDAGVSYEFSETSDTSSAISTEEYVNSEGEVRGFIATEIEGIGFEAELKFIFSTSSGKGTENGTSSGITTGYALADDDPGDAFTVDVKMDSVHGTPVFKTLAGQSSCPWEEHTANREAPNLQLDAGSQFVATNVPAKEPAFFRFALGNLSASNEDWTYGISEIVTNNPDGAIIKLNGEPFDETKLVIVPFGTSVPVTVTVERGPSEYDYEGLRIGLYSNCQFERNLSLALPLDNDPKFFSYVDIDVHFVRPCSEVQINVPEQNYVVLNDDPAQPGTLRRITTSGYNKNDEFFGRVRVQYRSADGDGAWINITPVSDILKADLGPIFTQFEWETAGLPDGEYEIRAVAVCTGDAADRPGYSDIIKIRIDREPPKLVGVPQPSDGVYHVGDEISFTFNQHVNCDKLIQADQTQPNNVGLYDATTDDLIDIDVTCFENKIVLDPNFDNKFFENRVLRAELHGIEDLVGNESTFFKWEFFVDRNELAWLTDSLGITKYEDEPKVGTANIHNRGGYPVPFTIQGAPEWLHVVPNTGTLAPNEIRPIQFTASPDIAFGHWRDTVVLHTETGLNPFFMGGDEALPLAVRVVCRPPYDGFNPDLYENSMTMVLRVNIEGTFSTDPEDIVAAFIDDELRGRAYVQFIPQLNDYRALLFIYGDPSDMLKPIRLEVWDASQCERYGSVLEQFDFQPDNAIGTLTNPQVIHTGGLLMREVPFNYGWNWLSFNLAFPDNSLNAALASVKHPENDLMKSQTAFSEYFGGWFGTLTNLNNTSMYIYRADVADTLRMQGTPINPATTPVSVVAGWNWIGYVPNYALPTNTALASLPAQPGDIIKGQHAFSEYLNPTFGWVGNLKYMSPPNGYQIRLAQAGTLTYPPKPTSLVGEETVQARGETELPATHWTVDPTRFEHSNTLIGMIRSNGLNATTSDMELGAFAGDEVRGTTQAIYIEPLDAHLFFLTTYANASGELLRFKLFNDADGSVRDLSETMYFAPNQHQGSVENPVPFEVQTTSAEEDFGTTLGFDVQPNPFSSETTLRFNLPQAEEVLLTISDAQGREVVRWPLSAATGQNVATWNGRSDTGSWLSSGVYTVRLQTEAGSVLRKVVLQRLP